MLFYIPYLIISTFFLFFALYWAITMTLGLLYKEKEAGPLALENRTLVLLPAYKPDHVFKNVLDTVNQYKPKNAKVYILFQNADKEIVNYAKGKYDFESDEKSFSELPGNSYQHALKFICSKISMSSFRPEYIILLDKDNIVDEKFFINLYKHAAKKADVVQGRRVPIKTTGKGAYEVFDSVSELLNDTMFRAAKAVYGGYPELSGSGVLIRTDIFIKCIESLDESAPGFDKNFMINLITFYPDIKFDYAPSAMVYEEKTSDKTVYKNQRIRWFGEQYYNLWYKGRALLKQGFSGNLKAFDYFLTLLRPPRSIFIIAVFIGSMVEILLSLLGWAYYFNITMAFLIIIVPTLVFLLKHGMLSRMLSNLLELPKLVFSNIFSSFLSLKKENRGVFIHTERKKDKE